MTEGITKLKQEPRKSNQLLGEATLADDTGVSSSPDQVLIDHAERPPVMPRGNVCGYCQIRIVLTGSHVSKIICRKERRYNKPTPPTEPPQEQRTEKSP